MALTTPAIFASAIMLDAFPELTGQLNIMTVPVIFVGQRRYDGPMNEWILAQQVRLAAEV
ncbi:hypothetical protein HIJ39_06120 [Sulfobacillus sp. DSM 109850]|uniref:Thioredoxin-like fold domain-containing protein n=2 Tax=Sulfobacillus harzensis TaxID=2729629 RepID=A0A7Y0L251_9FIRM|nr:hypothetical protein [Sulfobacillus harzensis]NMP21927.1 hypothetical protein [Sulfobacillus harzensis]